MTGVNELVASVRASGDQRIDAILHTQYWFDGEITYSLPKCSGVYGSGHGGGEPQGLIPASALMREIGHAGGLPVDIKAPRSALCRRHMMRWNTRR